MKYVYFIVSCGMSLTPIVFDSKTKKKKVFKKTFKTIKEAKEYFLSTDYIIIKSWKEYSKQMEMV
jgi:hypothetical protein